MHADGLCDAAHRDGVQAIGFEDAPGGGDDRVDRRARRVVVGQLYLLVARLRLLRLARLVARPVIDRTAAVIAVASLRAAAAQAGNDLAAILVTAFRHDMGRDLELPTAEFAAAVRG